MTLFLKECRKVLFSIPFAIIVVVLILFMYMQSVFPNFDETITKPLPTDHSFGTHAKEVPEKIMPEAINMLYKEFSANQYITYPIGFYKTVRLSENKQDKIAEIIANLSGKSVSEIKSNAKVNNNNKNNYITINGKEAVGLETHGEATITITIPDNAIEKPTTPNAIIPIPDLSYTYFKAEMAKVDKLLGGGSHYSTTYIINDFGQVPITYEEAVADYSSIRNYDKFTGAYARLFSDYLGLMLALLPAFLAVALFLKDRTAKMTELVFARSVPAWRVVMSRYFAIVLMIMIPTIIIFYISNASTWTVHAGEMLDYLAPLKYSLGWLLPAVMISTAIGMTLTVLTDTPIAIVMQSLWWFLDLNASGRKIYGRYDWFALLPRHNTLEIKDFEVGLNSLILNRIFYVGLSIVLLSLTIYLYNQKRKGYLNGYDYIKTLFAHHKNKSAT